MRNKSQFLFWGLILHVCLCNQAYTQQPKASQDFVSIQFSAYKNWLAFTNLNRVLKPDTIVLVKGKYVLQMKVKDANNWRRLVAATDSTFKNSLPGVLLERFRFQMDVKPEDAEINLDAVDAAISISSAGGRTSTRIWNKMGSVSDGLELPVPNLKNLAPLGPIVSKRSLDEVKTRLTNGLRDFFKPYQARMGSYRFEVLYRLDNKLIIEVNNVVNAVLDEGYFEHIQLDFDFQQENGAIKLLYDIKAKYAAGLIWAPQSSRYRDMIPDYEQALQHFSLKMSNKIGELIK